MLISKAAASGPSLELQSVKASSILVMAPHAPGMPHTFPSLPGLNKQQLKPARAAGAADWADPDTDAACSRVQSADWTKVSVISTLTCSVTSHDFLYTPSMPEAPKPSTRFCVSLKGTTSGCSSVKPCTTSEYQHETGMPVRENKGVSTAKLHAQRHRGACMSAHSLDTRQD